MDQQNAELEKRLEKLEQEFSDMRKTLDELVQQTTVQAVPKNEKMPKGKLFLRVCIPILIVCLLTGGFFYYRASQKPSYAKAEIGDIVTFGRYEQNNSEADGQEPIEWIVLDKQDERILLLSRYILFQDVNTGVSWNTCSLRQSLNKSFISTAFSPNEQSRICETDVIERIYSSVDKVFLLSVEEAEKYFPSDDARKSDYTYSSAVGSSAWGLRSFYQTKKDLFQNAFVNINGEIDEFSFRIPSTGAGASYGVRPAIWLDTTE